MMGKNKKKNRGNISSSSLSSESSNSTENPQNAKKIESSPTTIPEVVPETSENTFNHKHYMNACLVACRLARLPNTVEPKYHAKSQRYIIENFDDAVREPSFYEDLTKDDIVVFLQSDDLIVSCEEVIYHMVVKWVKHKPSERTKYLEELLELVRFPQLELEFLCHQVVHEPLILNTPVGQVLIHEAYEYHNEQRKLAKAKN